MVVAASEDGTTSFAVPFTALAWTAAAYYALPGYGRRNVRYTGPNNETDIRLPIVPTEGAYRTLSSFENMTLPHEDDMLNAAMKDLLLVVSEHGLDDKAGVALLHTHFDVADDEALVTRINPGNDPAWADAYDCFGALLETHEVESITTVKKIVDVVPGSVTPYMFTFGESGPQPLEFVENSITADKNFVVISSEAAFLKDFEATVARHGMRDKLGLVVLRNLNGSTYEIEPDNVKSDRFLLRLGSSSAPDPLLTQDTTMVKVTYRAGDHGNAAPGHVNADWCFGHCQHCCH